MYPIGRDRVWAHGMVERTGLPLFVKEGPEAPSIIEFQPTMCGLPADVLQRVFRDLRAKDPDVYHHGHRVAVYATVIGEALGLNDDRLAFLGAAAWLHDLGKLHVAKGVRYKDGKLTEAEYEEMKKHVRIGARLLRSLGSEGYATVALQHHEWYSGWGYPFGIEASKLSMEVQITSVADAYDAMTYSRCYRAALPHDRAIGEIARYSGIQFSPAVVRALLAVSSHVDQLRSLLGEGCPSVSDLEFVRMVAAG